MTAYNQLAQFLKVIAYIDRDLQAKLISKHH